MKQSEHDDAAALRQHLRDGLTQSAAHDSQALQQRVLAQWAQRHALAQSPAHATLHAGRGALHLSPRAWVWGAVCIGLLVLALMQVGSQRADADLEELSQPDVLSQISLDEL
jgi:hypothetical protein